MAPVSISRLISTRAESDPDRTLVLSDDASLTARELDLRSNQLARAYVDLGVGLDDMVMVVLPNSSEFVVVCVAIWKAGATPMPVSPSLDASERAAVEHLARPRLVVGAQSSDSSIPWVPAGYFVETASAAPLEDAWASCWKAPTSSGSTGQPKIVRAAAPAQFDPSRPVAAFLPRQAVQLVSGPISHSASFTYAFRGLMTGHSLVILPRFDERRVLEAVEKHSVTWTLWSPTMIHRLLRVPSLESFDVTSLESVLHMGSPIDPDDKRALMTWLGPSKVVEVYAGSESNGLTMIGGDEWLERPGSVGKPIGGTEIRIVRPDDSVASSGEAGLIWMRRGSEPSYSYIGGQSRRTNDGWDTLGDIGMLDDDGYLTILDRAADVIVRDGLTIYPAEVERALESHPSVRSAVVFGIADSALGQVVEAVVDMPTGGVSIGRLQAWVRERLGEERTPFRIRVQHEPLRNDAGKVRRSSFGA